MTPWSYNRGAALIKKCAAWRAPSFFVYGERENGAADLLKRLHASFNVIVLDVEEIVRRCPKSDIVADLLGGSTLTDEGLVSLLEQVLQNDDVCFMFVSVYFFQVKFRGYALYNVPMSPEQAKKLAEKGHIPEYSIIFDVFDDEERRLRGESVRVDAETETQFSARLVHNEIKEARLKGQTALDAIIAEAEENEEELEEEDMLLENTTDMVLIESHQSRIDRSLDAISMPPIDPETGRTIGVTLGSAEVWCVDTTSSISSACDAVQLRLWEAGLLPSPTPRRLPTPADVDEANCYETLRTQGCERTGARRWSPWLQYCPVTLFDKHAVEKGRVDFAVEFLGHIFLLANEGGLHRFIQSPQKFLTVDPYSLVEPDNLRVVVLGPPWSGLTTQCQTVAENYGLVHLDIKSIIKEFLELPIPALSEEMKEWETKKEEEKAAARGRPHSRGMYRSRSRSPSVSRSSSLSRSRSNASSIGGDDEMPTINDMPQEIIDDYKLRKVLLKSHAEIRRGRLLPLDTYSFAVFRKIKQIQDDNIQAERPHRWIMDGYPLVEEQVLDLSDKYQVERYIILSGDGEALLPRLEKMNIDAETGTLLTSEIDTIESPLQLKFPMATMYSSYQTEMADIEQTLIEIDAPISRAPFSGDVCDITAVLNRAVNPLDQPALKGALIEPEVAESEAPESIDNGSIYDDDDDDGSEAGDKPLLNPYTTLIEGEDTMPANLGESSLWCPVTLDRQGRLVKGMDKFSASYDGYVYRMASAEARRVFLSHPGRYSRVNTDSPIVPPEPRIWVLGAQGSQCSEHATELAKSHGLQYVNLEQVARSAVTDPEVWSRFDSFDITTPPDASPEEASDAESVESDDKDSVSAFGSRIVPIPGTIISEAMANVMECNDGKGCVLDAGILSKRQVAALLKAGIIPEMALYLSADKDQALDRLDLEPSDRAKLKAIADAGAEEESELSARDSDDDEDMTPMDSGTRAIEYIEELRETIRQAAEHRFEDEVAVLQQTLDVLAQEHHVPIVKIDSSPRKSVVEANIANATKIIIEWRRSMFSRTHVMPISRGRAIESLQAGFVSLSPFRRYCPVTWVESGELVALPDTIAVSEDEEHDEDTDSQVSSVDGNVEVDDMLAHTLTPSQIGIAFDSVGSSVHHGQHSYPVVYRQFVFYCASSEAATRFAARPAYYAWREAPPLRQTPLIAVIGPAGSGKSKTAQRLAERIGAIAVTPADALSMATSTALMAKIQTAAMESGAGIDLINAAVKELRYAPESLMRGVVLDGWPESKEQVDGLDLDAVVCLELEYSNAVERLNADHEASVNDGGYYTESVPDFEKRHSVTQDQISSLVSHLESQRTPVIKLPTTRSRWWIGAHAQSFVHNVVTQAAAMHMSRTTAVPVDLVGISPSDLKQRLSKFGSYCIVSFVDRKYLVKGTKLIDYDGHFYHVATDEDLVAFMANPHHYSSAEFTDVLPSIVDSQGPFAIEGYCPVSFVQRGGGPGKELSAFVRGREDLCVEYDGKLYSFASVQARDAFMLEPWTYVVKAVLPVRRPPPELENVSLGDMPLEGYLDQTVIDLVNAAMLEVGQKRPKYPFLSTSESASLFIALWLRSHNDAASEFDRNQHDEKLADFIGKCNMLSDLAEKIKNEVHLDSLSDEFEKLGLK